MADEEPSTGSKGVGKMLTDKIGPLPAWTWAALFVGVFLGYRFFRYGSIGGASPAPKAAEPDIVVDPYGNTGNNNSYGMASGAPGGSENLFTGQGKKSYLTNLQWQTDVGNYLIGQGWDPALVASALFNYVNGLTDKITREQQGVIRIALTWGGLPPEGVLNPGPVTTNPNPGTDNPDPPDHPDPPDPPDPGDPEPETRPNYISVRAKPGDTLSSIAARYGLSWQDVWNFNLKWRSDATQAVLRSRGPNLTYANSEWWIPR